MNILVKILAVLLLGGLVFLAPSPVKTEQPKKFSYGKKCISGKLYWVYDNPILGQPFQVPVGDGDGNHVECSEG